MHIKASSSLRNDYGAISLLAHETREPVYITKNGEGDLVVMDIEAFEERERMLDARAAVLDAERRALNGEPAISLVGARERIANRLTAMKSAVGDE